MMFGKSQKQSLGDMGAEDKGAAEMDGAPDEHNGDASPRLSALHELLKFLSHSEAKRAMPKDEPAEEPAHKDELDDEHLLALKHMAR